MTVRAWIASATIVSSFLTMNFAASASEIEAIPGKQYVLTPSRGPWMIMVTTFHATSSGEDGEEQFEGKTPREAADELVLELRQLGFPAYVHEYEQQQDRIKVTDRLGREEYRKNLRRYRSVYVIGGNYSSLDDKVAQDSLAWIKKLKPKCLQEGVVYMPTPGRPGPLSGAFLTPNPLLSPEQIEERSIDPLLLRLNSGERYSLLENPGDYTLVIARFYGKSMTVKGDRETSAISQILKDNDLDNAALAARELVTVLRGEYDKEATNFNNVDAYIWHDRHESVVTVGSFKSKDDPQLAKYFQRFGPKIKVINGTPSHQPEHLGVSGFGPKKSEARLWLFEPNPEPMRIPRKR